MNENPKAEVDTAPSPHPDEHNFVVKQRDMLLKTINWMAQDCESVIKDGNAYLIELRVKPKDVPGFLAAARAAVENREPRTTSPCSENFQGGKINVR